MRVLFHKFAEDEHQLEVIRDDGSREARLLESRSLLLHDFVHYAVESELPITDGFFGTLARGVTFAQLDAGLPDVPGLGTAESLVGPMQSVVNGRLDAARYRTLSGTSDDFVDRTIERVRRLRGLWRATAWRSAMELPWPPAPL